MIPAPLSYTAEEIRDAEAPLLAAGVPLMEKASQALAEVILAELASPKTPVLFLVGPGNNGGDGLYSAAALASQGISTHALVVSNRIHNNGYIAAERAGVDFWSRPGASIETIRSIVLEDLSAEMGPVVVVDAMLGIGSSPATPMREPARSVALAINDLRTTQAPITVIAADIPSGLDPDTGIAPDRAVIRADMTVTFGALKKGMLIKDGPLHCGKITIIDIGLGPYLHPMP